MESISLQRKIHMVDVLGQYRRYQQEIDAAVLAVIGSGAYINGPMVREFEQHMAGYLGVRHAIGCASGTDALQIAMMALGIGPGDEVLTTPFTFVATTETIALLGAKPVYVDIDPATFNIDVSKIESKITSRTRAIIPVHLFGQPANLTELTRIAEQYHLPLIEDAAQAVGAKWLDKRVCGFGQISAISFYPSKNLGAFGDAGMITTDDDALAEQIRTITNHGSDKTYRHVRLGVNSRLDAVQAAILNVKLKYLDEWNATRRSLAEAYTRHFTASGAELTLPFVDGRAEPIWHQYSVVVPNHRDEIVASIRAMGIPCNIYYPIPLHLQPAYIDSATKIGSYPESEFLADHIFSLPMHSELTEDEVEYIASSVADAVKQSNPQA